jgi:large subunit ribosomal protein L28
MPRMCELCGKKTTFGNTIARRGRAKYLGGVGVKTTGITRRKFIPNLQKVRSVTANGTVKRVTVCAQCLRSGKIVKPKARPKVGAAAKS